MYIENTPDFADILGKKSKMKKQILSLSKSELTRAANKLEKQETEIWAQKKNAEGYYALLDIAWQCAKIRGMKQVYYDLLGRFSE